MDPLLSLRSLSSYIEHSVRKLPNNESSLSDTSGLHTRSKDILVVWHVIVLGDSVDVVEVAEDC